MNTFEALAERYDDWYRSPYGKLAFQTEKECLRAITGKVGVEALEVGVGSGRFASYLGIRYGLDPSLNLLKRAKLRGVRVVRGTGEALPFRKESFEHIFMIVTLCFVSSTEMVIEESSRVLRKKGTLVLGFITEETPLGKFYREKAEQGHPFYSRAKFYSREEVKQLVKVHFEILEERVAKIPGYGEIPEGEFLCLKLRRM
ncbi:MAG TPA: class I SAM-dependent methyltransferase [Euryarchaeota archaeon]|nr:class I SAM-dependent methyltransferase [Euryarchaeota archaeon]